MNSLIAMQTTTITTEEIGATDNSLKETITLKEQTAIATDTKGPTIEVEVKAKEQTITTQESMTTTAIIQHPSTLTPGIILSGKTGQNTNTQGSMIT